MAASATRQFEFHKRSQLFVSAAQRNAFRRRGVRQQSRLFAIRNQWLRPSPSSNRRFLRLSAIISQYLHAAGFCRFCAPQNNDVFWLRVPEFPLKLLPCLSHKAELRV